MKRIFAILSILLYFNALIIPVFPLFNYVVNTDIYESLCINKDKPQMDCHGKCHLIDELSKEESSNKTKPILDINLKDYPIGFINFIELDDVESQDNTIENHYKNIYKLELEHRIFHPPKKLV